MTVLFDQVQAGQAQTHILALGVGAYPYLNNGSGRKTTLEMGLGQLTSPPVSARAFAGWALENFHNPDAPLGSLELLLSESPARPFILPNQVQQNIEPASMANIKAAFDRWFSRCNSHADNIAIFYFCGHGVTIQGDRILLAEDYGESDLRPFENAINFDKTYRGMAICAAKQQCYFIDACRQVPVAGLELEDAGAVALAPPRLRGQKARDTAVLNASAPDASAYGRPNQPSRFTEALILALNGIGSRKVNSRYIVTTARLGEAVVQLIDQLNRKYGGPVQISPFAPEVIGQKPIHVPRNPPKVPAILHFVPPQAIGNASLSLLPVQPAGQRIERQPPEPRDWEIKELPVGFYQLEALFPATTYKNLQQLIGVDPPMCEETFPLEAI